MSITGQVGHIGIARQNKQIGGNSALTGGGATPASAAYTFLKVTGDSLVSNNNPLIAEGEIGLGRDVSQMVPGGYSAAGAINGNLRTRAADVLLEGALGTKTKVGSGTTAYNVYSVVDDLPWWSLEKKVGSSSPEQMFINYQDAMINTLNIAVPAGGLATFSAGLITCSESKSASSTAGSASYASTSDDLLVFHGGRIRVGDAVNTGTPTVAKDETFQSIEIAINNNIAADEYTIRPSRFLRSLTEGIRSVDCNMTLVFEDPAKYQQYEYGSSSATTPGYSFYKGSLEVFVGNWQATDTGSWATPSTPSNTIGTGTQAVQFNIPNLAFTGFPVALTSGRIVVTTSARALKNTGTVTGTDDIIRAFVRTAGSGTDYTAATSYYC